MNLQSISQTGSIIELCCEYLPVRCIWLHFVIMSRTRSRVYLHTMFSWMSGNFLLKTGAISEVQMIETWLEPSANKFVNEHATIYPNWPNNWVVFWILTCMVHSTVWTYYVMYTFQSKSTPYTSLKPKEARYLKFKWMQQGSNQQAIIL